jgi:hypothetical protein
MAKEAPAPTAPAPTPESIAKGLAAAKGGPLPEIALDAPQDGVFVVRLEYASSELHGARCSADAAFLAGLPGHTVTEASQADRVASASGAPVAAGVLLPHGAAVHAGAVCTFTLRRG